MSETTIVYAIAGLPGSGKSTWGKKFSCSPYMVFYDDIMAHSKAGDVPDKYRQCRHLTSLVTYIAHNRTCVVSDILFCKKQEREAFEQTVRDEVRKKDSNCTVHFKWIFVNTPAAKCKERIESRDRSNKEVELKEVDKLLPDLDFNQAGATIISE